MLSFFLLDVLDEIWDVIESVSEGFLPTLEFLSMLLYNLQLFFPCSLKIFKDKRPYICLLNLKFLTKNYIPYILMIYSKIHLPQLGSSTISRIGTQWCCDFSH